MGLKSANEKFWSKINDDIIECKLCPRSCRLSTNKKGFCLGRENISGQMVLKNYEKCSAASVDPIEKKPLYHFYPGSNILSIGTLGCNLDCKFCQNWNISKPGNESYQELKIENIIDILEKQKIKNVAFTYNEPITFAEFAMDVSDMVHEKGGKTVCVSAGYIEGQAREIFFSKMDAVNIDLKSFNEDFYKDVCGGHLKPVLDTLKYIKQNTDIWLEITTLVVPGLNDSEKEINKMIDWVIENLGENVPWHFSAFYPTHKLTDIPRTGSERLLNIRSSAIKAGVRYVYIGNLPQVEASNTYCGNCGKIIIDRNYYDIKILNLKDKNRCRFCGYEIKGIF